MEIDETIEIHNKILDIIINDERIKDKLKGLINCILTDLTYAQDISKALESLKNLEEFLNLQDYQYKGIDFWEKEELK